MELVARAFSVFFQNIKEILFVMLVVFLPVSLLDSIILTRLNAINSFLTTVQTAGTILENEKGITQALYQTISGSLLSMAIALFLVPVGTIAIAKMAKQRIDGEVPDVKTALKDALTLEPTIIVAGIISGVLTTLGMFIIIPGIWLSVFWALYLYCIGLGGRKDWDSLRHSGELVRGRWWRTLGYMIALSCIASLWDLVIAAILAFVEIGIGKHFIVVFIENFASYLSRAFAFIGMALLFINRESQYLGWQLFGEKKNEELNFAE